MRPIAAVGDEIVIEPSAPGQPPLVGTVRGLRGEGDNLHYRVRWQDGNETAVFPAYVACEIRPGWT
jgi:hypothetical protein